MEARIITLEDLRREIREYGISKLAREIGFSRQHIQRIAGGQRNPSAKLLRKLDYIPITVFRDLTPPKTQQ
jgi:transcriptional regulator with XRE-family HTH domain